MECRTSKLERQVAWLISMRVSFFMGALSQMGSDKYGHWGRIFIEG
jgi:hypothetical protein